MSGNDNTYTKNRAIGGLGSASFLVVGNRTTVHKNLARDNLQRGAFRLEGNDVVVLLNKAFGNRGSGFTLVNGSGFFVLGNTAQKNELNGIRLEEGAINSQIVGNIATGNTLDDLFDGNFLPSCDDNKWKWNWFKTRNQTCIR